MALITGPEFPITLETWFSTRSILIFVWVPLPMRYTEFLCKRVSLCLLSTLTVLSTVSTSMRSWTFYFVVGMRCKSGISGSDNEYARWTHRPVLVTSSVIKADCSWGWGRAALCLYLMSGSIANSLLWGLHITSPSTQFISSITTIKTSFLATKNKSKSLTAKDISSQVFNHKTVSICAQSFLTVEWS